MHPAATKKNRLRRVGAWCTRLIARVSKHPEHKDKSRDAGSPVTENESWITTTQGSHRTRWNSSSDDTFGGGVTLTSTAETDRAPSYLAVVPVCRTTAASNRSHRTHSTANSTSNSRSNRVHQRTEISTSNTISTTASEDPLRDELSLIASQRLHVAGLYVQAQHLKRKKLRELSYQRSMQLPLNHIQVRRRLSREKEHAGAGGSGVITPSFVCIRKAILGRDARRRLKIFGFSADDSVPPWIPSTATAGRWSCELTVGSPRSATAFEHKQQLQATQLAGRRASSEYSSKMCQVQLQQPHAHHSQSARDTGI